MNTLEFLIALRRRWRVIAIITAATMAIAWITTPSASKKVTARQYEASQKLGARASIRITSQWDQFALKATYGAVPRTVALHLNASVLPDTSNEKKTSKGAKQSVGFVVGDDKAKAVVTPDPVTSSLAIVVTSPNRDLAKSIADDMAASLVAELQKGYNADFRNDIKNLSDRFNEYVKEQTAATAKKIACPVGDVRCREAAQNEAANAHSQATEMRRQINQKRNLGRMILVVVPINEDAIGQAAAQSRLLPPESSSGLPKSAKVRLPLGFGLGLLLGALGAFLISRFDSAVYGIPATEAAARLPVLAEIPHVTSTRRRRFEVLTQLSPLSGVADAYRGLRTSIGLMWLANESESGQNEPRTLLVASPGPNEGKSTTSANLAAAYAEIGKRVVVVDLDFRRQRLHRFLGANAEPYLQNTGSLSDPVIDLPSVIQQTSIPGVQFIGSASPDSTPAEAAVAGRAAIMAACEIADIVIIDTPPLLLTNDTFDLLDLSDAVVLLARDAKTKTAALSRAGQQLKRLDAPVVGIALIGAISSRPGYGYGYGYGYRYGYSYGYGYGSRTGVTQARRAADASIGVAGSDASAQATAVITEIAVDTAAAPTARRGRFSRRGQRVEDSNDSSTDSSAGE